MHTHPPQASIQHPNSVAPTAPEKPRLPAWLSVPVLICGFFMTLLSIALAVGAPLAVLLGFVPLVLVLPVLGWLDRVEPKPRSSKIHAILWGATVATFVSIIINSIVSIIAGETVGAVVSAPIVEEATKALGIVWAVRRAQVDGVMDGVVYAGWVALGFAVVEDFLYFSQADEQGMLVGVFVVRAILTPFAHPLFTAWTGMAIGLAVHRGVGIGPYAFGGYVVAVLTHAAWNGSLSWADSDGAAIVLIAALLFIVLFIAVAIALYRLRRKEQKRFVALAPMLAQRYGLPANEVAAFAGWKPMLAARKSLPKENRARFDRVHAALARLATLHDRPNGIDPVTEQVLITQLAEARR